MCLCRLQILSKKDRYKFLVPNLEKIEFMYESTIQYITLSISVTPYTSK